MRFSADAAQLADARGGSADVRSAADLKPIRSAAARPILSRSGAAGALQRARSKRPRGFRYGTAARPMRGGGAGRQAALVRVRARFNRVHGWVRGCRWRAPSRHNNNSARPGSSRPGSARTGSVRPGTARPGLARSDPDPEDRRRPPPPTTTHPPTTPVPPRAVGGGFNGRQGRLSPGPGRFEEGGSRCQWAAAAWIVPGPARDRSGPAQPASPAWKGAPCGRVG